MTRLVVSITTPLPREAAFAYVADFARQAEWDPNTVSSKRIDDGELGVGARFALEAKAGPATMRMEYRITEFDPPTKVVLIGEGRGVWSEDRITFSRTGEGTRVEYHADLRLKGLLALLGPLLPRYLSGLAEGVREGMQRELDAIAAGERPA